MRSALKKQGLALGISILLVVLIFFILISPPTVTAVKVSAGDPSPTLGTVGYDVTFTNVSVTIRGNEAIPVDFLNFTIHNNDNGAVISYVNFSITGDKNSDPDDKFTITLVSDISSIYQSSGNFYGYDERSGWNASGYPYSYGYGSGLSDEVVANFSIVFETAGITPGTFYANLSVNSSVHTYTSKPSDTFTVSAAGDDDDSGGSTTYSLTADAKGPYSGVAGNAVSFSGSATHGISPYSYAWSFGDGGSGTGASTTHTYSTAGTYTATLTVTDHVSSTDQDTATVTITAPAEPPSEESSEETMDNISEEYGVELEEPFYANDTDGDGKVDTLTDPNGILTQVQNTTINGNVAILVSTDDDEIPEFFWDPEADTVTSITHSPGTVSDEEIDPENETLTVTVTVEKEESHWIYLDITDNYPDYAVTIKTSDGRTISSDMLWRENGKIYVLDDPDTEYILIYSYKLLAPTFDPLSGTSSNVSKPTITITYKEAVTIESVSFTFNQEDIQYDSKTSDDMTYTFTPLFDLTDNGILKLTLTVRDNDDNTLTSSARYTIELPGVVTHPSEKEKDGIPWFIIAVIIVALIILFFVYLFKIGYLYIEYEEYEKGDKTDHTTKETKPHKKSDTSAKDSKTEKKKK